MDITNKRIIYQTTENGFEGVAVIIPMSNRELTIEQIAQKDVPANTPYKIVNVEDIPFDRTFRAAWEADIQAPDGHGIGHDAWFAQQENNNDTN